MLINGLDPEGAATQYLIERGITLDTVKNNKVELCTRVIARDYRLRLGVDHWPSGGGALHETVKESIWFPCRDANSTIHSWTVRPFPTANGTNAKFLTSRDGGGYPFIPVATWNVASKASYPLLITEGPIKALAALQSGAYPIAIHGAWMAAKKDEDGTTFLHPAIRDNFSMMGRAIYVAFDADFIFNPAVRQALIRTVILLFKEGADVKILVWPIEVAKGLDDYLVVAANGSKSATLTLQELCTSSRGLSAILQPSDLSFVQMEMKRAALSKSSLNQLAKIVAPSLRVRSTTLEQEARIETPSNDRTIMIRDPDPWPDPVDLAELLTDICARINEFVSLTESDTAVVALWVMLTHAEAYVDILPMLRISSPQKRCGKTTLLRILMRLVRRNFPVSSLTPATVYRIIEKWHPSFLIDEADTFMKENEELRGIINSGHQRDMAWVPRCNPVTLEPERWSTWAPKAIALIGDLPETITDRCVSVCLKRQTKDEKKKLRKLRRKDLPELVKLCQRASRWIQDSGDNLKDVEVDLPNDRSEDNWSPLLSIAQAAGNEWYEKALRIAQDLGGSELEGDNSFQFYLLSALRDITKQSPEQDFFGTKYLLAELNKDDEAPWATWKDKMVAKSLAKALKPYGIKPAQGRHGGEPERGYSLNIDKDPKRVGLRDVFDRYLPENDECNGKHPLRNTCENLLVTAEDPLPELFDDKSVTRNTRKKVPLGVCVFPTDTVLSPENGYGTKG